MFKASTSLGPPKKRHLTHHLALDQLHNDRSRNGGLDELMRQLETHPHPKNAKNAVLDARPDLAGETQDTDA
eukprot:6285925-Amphidinium_carterae.1